MDGGIWSLVLPDSEPSSVKGTQKVIQQCTNLDSCRSFVPSSLPHLLPISIRLLGF